MKIKLPASSKRFTPLEKAVLDAISLQLKGRSKELYLFQIKQINHIQRLLDWREIDFYTKRFPRRIKRDPSIVFPNKSEFVFASCSVKTLHCSVSLSLWAVSGYVFMIESKIPLKSLSFDLEIHIENIMISKEIMTEKEAPPVTDGPTMESDPG